MTSQTASLPSLVQDLSSSFSSLPPQLSSVNLTLVSTLLSTLSQDLDQFAPTLSSSLKQKLISDTDFLASHLSHLGELTSQIPAKTLVKSTSLDVLHLVRLFNDRYSIWTWYSPDLTTISLLFTIAIVTKLSISHALGKNSVARAQRHFAEQNKGVVLKAEIARGILRKPAVNAIGRGLNLVVSLIALGLQLSAYHIFVISSTSEPVRFDEVNRLYMAIKVLLVGYASDLLFGDYPLGPYLHHSFTFILLFVGQATVAETKNPLFYRLAAVLMLQGTSLPTVYLSLFLYHSRSYLMTQGPQHRPRLQRTLLKGAYYSFKITSFLMYPQKLLPAAFSLYWLAQMWNDMKSNSWGQAWLFLCTLTLSALLVLQMTFFNDQVFPLCNHMRFQLYGGPPPSRHGPLAQFVRNFFARKQLRQNRARGYTPIDTKEEPGFEKKRPDPVSWSSNESTPTASPTLLAFDDEKISFKNAPPLNDLKVDDICETASPKAVQPL